jgi:hypothetical protein
LLFELFELGVFFDALSECFKAEGFAELDEGVHECAGFAGGGDAGDEGAVDLERIDGELP